MTETSEPAQKLIDDELRSLELESPRPSHRIIELRTRRNTYSHISKLPVELFATIFLLRKNSALTTAAWHQITHVCRHWRQVALDTSLLWTNPTDCPLEYTDSILERSKTASLDIDLGYGSTTPLPAVSAIFKHSSRIKTLSMGREDVVEHAVQTLNSGEHQFARMEALRISYLDMTDSSQSYSVPAVFFAHSSVLRNLSLSIGRMEFNWEYLALPNLTSLYLGRMQLTQQISGDTLLRTLKGMTMLRTLHLDLSSILLPAAAQFSAAIHFSHLQSCALSGPCTFTSSLLSHIIMPQLQILRITLRHTMDHLRLSTAISSAVSNGAFGQLRSISIGKTRAFIAQEYPKSGNLKLSSIRLETHVLISIMQPLLSRLHKLGNNISEANFSRDLLPADLVALLGELPALEQLRIKTASNLEPFAVALDTYAEDSIPPLLRLTTIILDTISFDASLSRFCDALVKRHSTGHGIELLRLNGCTALSDHIRAMLQKIDVRVEEEDGREPNQIP